ncbi:UDP-GlcNAc--UDP-phosphate GlcNAc-1-phosphate transferase [Emticicia sp. W12TSBA100-4]|uniref:UDP-GlcNAc--UDP-phosphate GlcNAc-1-phosphate transferase n=1 Tax=Emticicia sp. W12TSBA100-4 TaxID=3160965 RepID=UPI003305AA3A
MSYLILTILLFLFELLYFYLAKKYQITDIPNQRSSHDEATIRGGGIIIWIACLIYFFFNKLNYPYFITATSLLAVISFWDDIKNISKRVRFITHLISLCIILYDDPFNSPLIYIIFIIMGLGILNGFNFMDGINGITVIYSLVCVASFFYVEQELFHFVDPELLLSVFISLLVFGFYNFRTKAKTFAGDVGSICIAFVFIFLQLLIFQQIHNVIFLFFFGVYGIDIIYTILLRLSMGENIFQAHRLHLFQLLKNEMGINPLLISFYYGVIQLLFNIGIFLIWGESLYYQILYIGISFFILVASYISIRKYIKFSLTK